MITILIDHRVPGAQSGDRPPSLLMLPAGVHTLLGYLGRCLGHRCDGDLLVLPDFKYDGRYEEGIASASDLSARALSPSALLDVLSSDEPEEDLLVIDPIQWPIHPVDVDAILSSRCGYAGFVHAVAVGNDPERIRECVEFDRQGRVRCVRRHFHRKNWSQVARTANFLSIGPARAVGNSHFRCLSELRTTLSARGVLNYDLPVALDVVALNETAGILSFNEQMLTRLLRAESPPDSYIRDGELLISPSAQIHPSARLIGPVALHRSVVIEEGATIIGPTVLGANTQVGCGATVAQSVLVADSVIPPGVTVRHTLYWEHCSDSFAEHPVEPLPDSGNSDLVGETVADSAADLSTRTTRIRDRIEFASKRTVDIALSLVALVILAPFLLIVALLIKLDSPGPALFAHRREQKGGKDFPCFKFRTMCDNAHHEQRILYKNNILDGPQFKLAVDPRVTRIGRLLRRYNLDELPQLINVLLGHMSLVGPRPSPFRENQVCLPWRRARLSVRPGITGLWQICRTGRTTGDFEQWIYYDVLYVKRMSLWLDFKILLATILTAGGMRRVPLSYIVADKQVGIAPAPFNQL